MSNGLLVDHSRNTIGMHLIVIIFKIKNSHYCLPVEWVTFFLLSAWNAITMEWASTPHATLFHMQSLCK